MCPLPLNHQRRLTLTTIFYRFVFLLNRFRFSDATTPLTEVDIGTIMTARSAGVRRLMREAAELSRPSDMYAARPMENNLFEWHFTIRGPPDSAYEGGIYHGRIILPHDYPMNPPSLIMLTPNGRFETNTKICLSISAYHPETWLPSWSIGTALMALIAFMTTPGKGAVGALECSEEQRKKMAKESVNWKCPTCDCRMADIFNALNSENSNESSNEVPVQASGDAATVPQFSAVNTLLSENSTVEEVDGSQSPTDVSAPQVEPQSTAAISRSATADNSRAMPTNVSTSPASITATLQPNVGQQTTSSTGFLIFVFSAIFIALLFRRLTS